MARIPDVELERLKAELSVERLVEASGIVLSKSGKDRIGKCPFHEDDGPSLVVTPSKNLWHCFGCGAAGGPIDWIMRTQGVSFRHAVERLKSDLALNVEAKPQVKHSSSRVIPPPVAFDADDQALLSQTIGFYHETLKTSPEALDYLQARGIHHPEAIERFKLGYANRTLGYSLPIKAVKAGGEIRGRLQKVGLFRESGHEHFTGSIVIPVMDEQGNVQEVYGRKILDNLRKGTPKHLYLPGPHKGVWNVEALQEFKEIILCEALIDALTFWCAGYRNVTAAYGVEGFTADHLEAFKRYGTKRVLIAYDRDEAGDRAAEKLAKTLMGQGIDCYRIQFPKGMDANSYALKVQPAAKSLGLTIRSAQWMGNGAAPADGPKQEAAKEECVREVLQQTEGLANAVPEAVPFLAADHLPPEPTKKLVQAKPGKVAAKVTLEPSKSAQTEPPKHESAPALAVEALPLPASPVPPLPKDEIPCEIQGQDLFITLEDRRYRVRGWQKALNPETLKVNLMVSRGSHFHVDSLDLYQAKARVAFIKQAGFELSEAEERLKLDLGKVLRKVEALQSDQLTKELATKEQKASLSETEHVEALALLKSPDLLERILRDFEALGVVGEESNKLTGYLAAVSRLLDRPLALLIQSASAAGKSSLMDAVLDLVPEEDVVRYSAMSGQSLFYMGDNRLQHKILAIAEEEGAKQASYALKLLQSEGRVTMASTGKDPATGMLVTHDYTVEGPVMLFLTTTAIDLDEELLNRCLVLSVNESREQTRAIHGIQRQRETLEGLLAKTKRESLLALHRNAQRLLQPLAVVNPFADQLSFRDDQTRSRRDHVKYLTLIRSIALLHQFQREVKTLNHQGQTLRYIEVIPSDIELANELAQEVLGRTVDELLPQTRKLLTLLHGWIREECERQGIEQSEFHFTRKQAREATGWGDTQIRVHLDRLMELEFLLSHRGKRGQSYLYELLYQGEDAEGRLTRLGLIDCANLTTTISTSRGINESSRGSEANFAGSSRRVCGPFAGVSRVVCGVDEASTDAPLNPIPAHSVSKTHISPISIPATVPSYPAHQAGLR